MSILLFIPVFVTVVGIYFIFKLRFFLFRPGRMLSGIRGLLHKRGAFKNLTLALAGTLGVGNIVGVAIGLSVGGAGSVFWLVLSAVPAAAIKYAESTLAVGGGFSGVGMMGALETSFERRGAFFGKAYALFALLLCFAMGAGLQSASLAEICRELAGLPSGCVLFALLLLVLPLLFVSSERIKDVTAVLVSIASVLYVALALAVIFSFSERVPTVLRSIFTEAFTPRAAAGGGVGASVILALREGFCRGILSNEAGLGTSALAHSTEVAYTPHEAGLVGVLEVIFDTVVLCPLTAVMLLAGGNPTLDSGAQYLVSALKPLGTAAPFLLGFSVFCFAFSTVVCWISYGKTSFSYLFGKKRLAFCIAFLISIAVGIYVGSESLVTAVDFIMMPLSVLSLAAVIKSSDRVKTLSELG